jgi:hypothetical protein
MSTIPAKKIERSSNHPDGGNRVCAYPADHIRHGEARYCFTAGVGT